MYYFPFNNTVSAKYYLFRFPDKGPLHCISFHLFLIRHYSIFAKTELSIWQKMRTKLTNQLTGRLFGLLHLVQNQSLCCHSGEFCLRPKLLVLSTTCNECVKMRILLYLFFFRKCILFFVFFLQLIITHVSWLV